MNHQSDEWPLYLYSTGNCYSILLLYSVQVQVHPFTDLVHLYSTVLACYSIVRCSSTVLVVYFCTCTHVLYDVRSVVGLLTFFSVRTDPTVTWKVLCDPIGQPDGFRIVMTRDTNECHKAGSWVCDKSFLDDGNPRSATKEVYLYFARVLVLVIVAFPLITLEL